MISLGHQIMFFLQEDIEALAWILSQLSSVFSSMFTSKIYAPRSFQAFHFLVRKKQKKHKLRPVGDPGAHYVIGVVQVAKP